MNLCGLLILTCLACVRANLLQLSCKERKAFVNGHNWRRQQVARGEIPGQPAAGNLKYMVWDEELAAKASAWASTYRKSHNPNKTIGSKRFSTGENLYWYQTTDSKYRFNVNQALTAWFDNEFKDYHYGPLVRRPSNAPQIGHYTQMVWADTIYLGCAISRFIEGRWTKYFVVCNYGPAGNIRNHLPYKSADADSQRGLTCVDKCKQPFGKKCR